MEFDSKRDWLLYNFFTSQLLRQLTHTLSVNALTSSVGTNCRELASELTKAPALNRDFAKLQIDAKQVSSVWWIDAFASAVLPSSIYFHVLSAS
jgi:hypothetical protein